MVDHQQGEAIPLLARILCLAQTAEVFLTAGGLPRMADVLNTRRGRWFDPQLVDILSECSQERRFRDDLSQPDILPLITALEPGLALQVDDQRLDAIAEAFAGVVDAKSPFTGRHSSNVAAIATLAARVGGLSRTEQQALYRAGLLHDLGKLAVPNTILDKPGALTSEEWTVLHRHPADTARILAAVPALAGVTAIAVAHHERMDGTGYHLGIQASTLPFAERLLAAADVYEALTASRPYRHGLTPQEAELVLAGMAGAHLDPEATALVTTACRAGIPGAPAATMLTGSAASAA